jgi:arsenite methyltransferase
MQSTFKTSYDINHPTTISMIDDLPLWSAPFGMKLLDKIIYRKNMNVLDVGSGNGFPIVELASRLGNTCNVFGIDPWIEANDRVRQKVETWGINNLKIINGAAEKLPFDNDYFDLIISNNGINNVEDEEKVLSEIYRTANHNAQLVLTVNLPESFIEFYTVYKKVLTELNMDALVSKIDEHIYSKRKPIEHTTKLIESTGFIIDDCETDGFEFKYADGSTFMDHFFIKLAFLENWTSILPDEKVSIVFDKIEEELNIIAEKESGISMTVPFVCISAHKK